MAPELASATSPGVPAGPTVLVPVGSIEQHGPHLSLDTDTVIATAVATRAADELAAAGAPVLVAPALAYGSSGEHQDFAGTSSIGTSVLHDVLVELTRSMRTWAARVVFVNAHGGNLAALRGAVRQLTDEGHDVGWVACATEEVDLHAGRTETSLMLHLAPWNVRLDRAERGNTGSLEELLPLMMSGGIRAVSPNGVLGDPSGASAEEGARVLAAMVADVVAATGAVARR
ncbi:mycofactocin biosynthesis peptidyl-dipeptidase MftE [Nocardioides daeguensis]|uniref:Mycofactocin biosynthesis peptidyl-dipeptidase MftE n=1 Tax=Nocardioides daeguensis TaxID=908359 RepID=A0ABP6V3V9_9ACTN|nr:mycofactocin biosynthesis peptidyl-dipeptidase MftE [Nocardioides daeguensis]MBV6726475.1 mycofactocin biosynthesis peptidyl-dipeptidase MftE [Nocardioides daeguensis]MCR1772318.1 mycofactocin biosynthesis peptidyl-dipeptidase MftE [Nocardioides daeguensis]